MFTTFIWNACKERMPRCLAISCLVGVSFLMSIRPGSMIPIQLYVWENSASQIG